MNKPSKADKLIYKALNKAIEKDQLRLYFDYGRINRPGSPVYDVWETLLPVLTPIIIGLILILTVSVIFGLAFIIAMILVYITYFKKKVDRYLIERTKTYFTSSYENCVKLWDFGGIVLVNAANKKQGCVSPEGDWKEFVVSNYADYMVESKDAPQQETAATHDQTA
ncbi:MAG: hypothetical protein OSJ76_06890 [Alphaproteobacteria bacterium]|nr:hypothetical protein [Alphaproteobacteria bacterium]